MKVVHKRSTTAATPEYSTILTIRQAAALLRCHTSTLYRLVKRGEIPAFRLGGSWRFNLDVLERWMRKSRRDNNRSSPS